MVTRPLRLDYRGVASETNRNLKLPVDQGVISKSGTFGSLQESYAQCSCCLQLKLIKVSQPAAESFPIAH